MKPRKLFFYPMPWHYDIKRCTVVNQCLNEFWCWCQCLMIVVNASWHDTDTDIQRAPAGHKNWVTRGGREVTAWQETQLWQRAGHRIRIQQRQSPWTTTRKQHNWHCAPQVPCQCPGPQCLACVCDHDWFGNIYNQKTWLIASCPAPTTTPTLP